MDLSKRVGITLKEKLEEKGFNYSSFAEAVGYRQSYISRIVKGDAPKIALQTLERLCQPLEMTVVEFLKEAEKKKPLLV